METRPGPKADICTNKLIESVKKRPPLYCKSNLNYHNHGKFKGQLWKEVCREVFPEWATLSPQTKLKYANDIKRRWKNLRNCFTKELSFQKQELELIRSGEKIKRKRKYIYFDKLSFLIDPEQMPEDPDIKKDLDDDDSMDNLEQESSQLESEESAFEENSSRDISAQNFVEIEEEPYHSQVNINPYQQSDGLRPNPDTINPYLRYGVMRQEVSQVMDEWKRNEVEDEDRQFALSIVPALRKLNDEQKFDAKIEILKVLKKISCVESQKEEMRDK